MICNTVQICLTVLLKQPINHRRHCCYWWGVIAGSVVTCAFYRRCCVHQHWPVSDNFKAGLKGQPRDFRFSISFPQASEYTIRTISNFFENSQFNVHHSVSRRLPDSPTRWVSESATPWLGKLASRGSHWDKKDSIEIVFSHTKVVFSPSKFAKKTRIWQFLAIPAAFNHRFIQKSIALL